MKTVSLKMDDSIFGKTEKILSRIRVPRNRYINEAIECYNKVKKRLKLESELVKNDSMDILNDLEKMDYAD